MEIVVVSDTVRQRRSRTPQSSSTPSSLPTTPTTKDASGSNLPDLLPTTFRLAESSSLFSEFSKPLGTAPVSLSSDDEVREHSFSVVEIRESNLLSPLKTVNMSVDERTIHLSKTDSIVNSVNILESADYFEPECVETVHIIDVTSEPSDSESSTKHNEVPLSVDSSDESGEYETDELPQDPLTVTKERITFRGRRKLFRKDRDVLKDSENDTKLKTTRKRLTPTLKEILTERDSFCPSDNETAEEALIFSDDDDNCDQPPSIPPITVFIIYSSLK